MAQVNDGTAKWELLATASNEDLTSLKNTLNSSINGKSHTYISSGSFQDKGTIPLPSGFSRNQCRYTAWFSGRKQNGRPENGYYLTINQSTGAVQGYVILYNNGIGVLPYYRYVEDSDNMDFSGTIDYLVIAVK